MIVLVQLPQPFERLLLILIQGTKPKFPLQPAATVAPISEPHRRPERNDGIGSGKAGQQPLPHVGPFHYPRPLGTELSQCRGTDLGVRLRTKGSGCTIPEDLIQIEMGEAEALRE